MTVEVEILTWNLNARNAATINKLHNSTAHFISLSLQEIYTQQYAVSSLPILNHNDPLLLDYANRILDTLNHKEKSERYTLLYLCRFIAIGLIVFVRTDKNASNFYISDQKLINFEETNKHNEEYNEDDDWSFMVLNPRDGVCGVGLGGVYGNKGAIAFGLDIKLRKTNEIISFCFVSMHLQAHEKAAYFKSRNESMSHIFDTLILEHAPTRIAQNFNTRPIWASLLSSARKIVWPATEYQGLDNCCLIGDHDAIFIGGDLNYRLNTIESIDSEAVRSKIMGFIEKEDWTSLSVLDELSSLLEENTTRTYTQSIAKPIFEKFKKTYEGFKEAPIQFAPTYKFKLSSPDKFIYSKKRLPAYCDRIIYKSTNTNICITNLFYRSLVELQGRSDHQLVSALFRISETDSDSDIVLVQSPNTLHSEPQFTGKSRIERIKLKIQVAMAMEDVLLRQRNRGEGSIGVLNKKKIVDKKVWYKRFERFFWGTVVPVSFMVLVGGLTWYSLKK